MRRASRDSAAHAELTLLLKTMRQEAGLSQLEVSVRLGDRPPSYISSIEKGNRGIDLIQVMELIALYGVSFLAFAQRFQERIDRSQAEHPPRSE